MIRCGADSKLEVHRGFGMKLAPPTGVGMTLRFEAYYGVVYAR
jgi:hypothetical protein